MPIYPQPSIAYPENYNLIFSSQLAKWLTESYPSTQSYLESLEGIGNTEDLLGRGIYGEVWMMDDDTVIKITASPQESYCVQLLFDLQEKIPGWYREFFPAIYEYGFINEPISFLDPIHHEVAQEALLLPVFWYKRENIPDFHAQTGEEKELFKDNIINNIAQVQARGIFLVDSHQENFGARSEDPYNPIFRDLVCYLDGEKFPYYQGLFPHKIE